MFNILNNQKKEQQKTSNNSNDFNSNLIEGSNFLTDNSNLNISNGNNKEKELNENQKNIKSLENEIKDNLQNKQKPKLFLIKEREKSKIFNIKKVIKLGRIKKNSSKIGKHDRYSQDNIIRRFKFQFTKSMLNYINKYININRPKNKKKRKIQKLSSLTIKLISKEDNLNWLNSKLRYIFSQKISTKLVGLNSDYNKKLIEKIYSKGEEKIIIQILEKTVREMWKAYITNDKNKYIGFETIEDDINKFKDLGESEEYIEIYTLVANNFEEIFQNIKQRKKKLKTVFN